MAETQPTQEQWRPVPGWEGHYEVSDQGRLRSKDRYIVTKNGQRQFRSGRNLKPDVLQTGYLQYTLQANGKLERKTGHRYVMLAFVGPAPEGMEVCHENGDKTDNRLVNLRYDTHSNNQKDQAKHGTNPWAARTHCGNGHPLSGDNLVMERGKRKCRECVRVRANRNYKERARQGGWEPYYGGECRNGHEFTPENTYMAPNGHRQCRTCRKLAVRRLRERRQRQS